MVYKLKNKQVKSGQTQKSEKTTIKLNSNLSTTNIDFDAENLSLKPSMTYMENLSQIIAKESSALKKSKDVMLLPEKLQEWCNFSKQEYMKQSEIAFIDTVDYFVNDFLPDITKKKISETSVQNVNRNEHNKLNCNKNVNSGDLKSVLSNLMMQQQKLKTETNIFEKFKPKINNSNQNFLNNICQTNKNKDDLKVC